MRANVCPTRSEENFKAIAHPRTSLQDSGWGARSPKDKHAHNTPAPRDHSEAQAKPASQLSPGADGEGGACLRSWAWKWQAHVPPHGFLSGFRDRWGAGPFSGGHSHLMYESYLVDYYRKTRH